MRTFAAGDERELYEADREAFADDWGRPDRPFDEWWAKRGGAENFDPSSDLPRVGRRRGSPAYSICAPRRSAAASSDLLGVRPAWRRRGLGLALLRHSFARASQRAASTRVGLGVDAANATGATRLYERAGMRVLFQADVYEKELEP